MHLRALYDKMPLAGHELVARGGYSLLYTLQDTAAHLLGFDSLLLFRVIICLSSLLLPKVALGLISLHMT